MGANANGTNNWGGGLTWVGERGRELVNLPAGSRVYSHPESMDMMGGGGDIVVPQTFNINAGMGSDPRAIVEALEPAMEQAASKVYGRMKRERR